MTYEETFTSATRRLNQARWTNICQDIQEMPQSRSTAFPRHKKNERQGTNNDKPNATYETPDIRGRKMKTTTEEPLWNGR